VSKARLDLPEPGQAGHHDQLVARQFERDILQVVHARALNRDGGARGAGLASAAALAASGAFPRWKNASSSTSTLLFLVSRTGSEALPISPGRPGTRTRSRYAFDAEVALEVVLDFGGGARLAHLAQIIDDRGEQSRRRSAR
jgi:hypothetical protein